MALPSENNGKAVSVMTKMVSTVMGHHNPVQWGGIKTSSCASRIICGRLDAGISSGSARPVAPPPFRMLSGWRLCAKSFRLFHAGDPLPFIEQRNDEANRDHPQEKPCSRAEHRRLEAKHDSRRAK